MKKWTILAPLGLAAAGAAALVLLKKKPEAKAAPAKGGPAKKPAPAKAPANLKTGSYSFISGFQNASTVKMTLDYGADRCLECGSCTDVCPSARHGGIIPEEPGYRRVRIDPQVPQGLEWVRVSQDTPYGTISVHREGRTLHLELPVGVTATVRGRNYGCGRHDIEI